MMSAPRDLWISITFSGPRKWVEPSKCDLKVTPSGDIVLSFEKAVYLKPATISQKLDLDQFIKAVKTTDVFYQLMAWPKIQMIRVGKNYFNPYILCLSR